MPKIKWHGSPELEPLLIPINNAKPNPANARLHPPENIAAIKSSLETLGQHANIVIHKKNDIVLIGNGRLQAAKELGWTHLAAAYVDDDEYMALLRSIADNRTSDTSLWDIDSLDEVIKQIKSEIDNFDEFWGDEYEYEKEIRNMDEAKLEDEEHEGFKLIIEVYSVDEMNKLYEEMKERGYITKRMGLY